MKTLLSFLAIGLTSIFLNMSFATATSLHPETFTKTADLFEFNVENDEMLKKLDIAMGQVQVNEVRKIARLIIQSRPYCPPNAMCYAGLIPHTVELPIIKTKVDGCGIITHIAEIDMMPVDGAKTTLIIRDNSKSPCEVIFPALTQVKLKSMYFNRMQGRLVRNSSSFLGEMLQ